MPISRIGAALGAVFIGHAWAQGLGNQINISMCNWQSLRANTIRDTVYLDGGQLWYQIGMSSGQVQYNNDLSTEYGLIYTLPLNLTFDTTTTNLTSLFVTMSKSGGTAANNEFPQYVDGVMFANDDEFYLYGGCLPESDLQQPADDSVFGYERYQYGAYKSSWSGGFIADATTDNNVTRYVSNGAGVSAPSEMLGFYVSGMRAPDWGPIYQNPYTNVTSNRMIKVDMSTERMNTWSNLTLPDYVVGRANAEAVWVPYGDSGVVVLIGGVVQPAQIFDVTGLTSAQKNQSQEISPGFMETVAVYDVAGDKWYLQQTTGDVPPQLTQFCSVYAGASDESSQNIYIYGGFDGLDTGNAPSDDAYVLSLPSFTWVKVYSGDSSHGRRGHRCVKPYPDQMLVIGGIWTDATEHCIDIIQVFNLNSARFQNTYNPTQSSNYQIPDLVSAVIGGDSNGGATKTAPSSWTNASLADVFATKYTKHITTWYPYNRTSTTPGPTLAPAAKSSSFPSWAGAIIGVVLGLLLIAGALWFWCVRRRRNQKGGSQRMSDVSGNRFHLLQWISTAEGPRSNRAWSAADGNESNAVPQSEVAGASISPPTTVEMLGEPVHEMLDRSTAPPAELPAELPSGFGDVPYHSPVPASTRSPGASPRGFVSPIPENEREAESPTQPDHRRISSLSWQSINIANVVRSSSQRGHTSQPSFGSSVSEASASEEAGPINGLGIDERLETTREDGV